MFCKRPQSEQSCRHSSNSCITVVATVVPVLYWRRGSYSYQHDKHGRQQSWKLSVEGDRRRNTPTVFQSSVRWPTPPQAALYHQTQEQLVQSRMRCQSHTQGIPCTPGTCVFDSWLRQTALLHNVNTTQNTKAHRTGSNIQSHSRLQCDCC